MQQRIQNKEKRVAATITVINDEVKTMENENTQTETQKTWLQEEHERLEANKHDGDYPEALKFEEGKIVYFNVNFSEEFRKWEGDDVVKKIVPVIDADGNKRVIWLNVRNPLYAEIIQAGVEGRTSFRVLRTGQKKETRYTVIKD